jgi:hypothetical protein
MVFLELLGAIIGFALFMLLLTQVIMPGLFSTPSDRTVHIECGPKL